MQQGILLLRMRLDAFEFVAFMIESICRYVLTHSMNSNCRRAYTPPLEQPGVGPSIPTLIHPRHAAIE